MVRADDKHEARLNLIRDLLSRLGYPGRKPKATRADARVAREFSQELVDSGWLAR